MSLLERTIEDQVCIWARKNKFLALKVKFIEAGWPDRLFLGHGASIFIEFKRPGEVPDKLQEFRLGQLRGCGIPAYWTDNALEGISILRDAMDSARVPEAGHTADVIPIGSGPVLGSRLGEDLYLSGGPKDFTLKELGLTSSHCSTPPPDVQRVAGGDKEVEGFQQHDLFHTPRDPEGDGPNYALTDSLD